MSADGWAIALDELLMRRRAPRRQLSHRVAAIHFNGLSSIILEYKISSRLKLAIPPRSHPMRAHQPTAGRSKPRPDHRTFDLNHPDRNWGLGRE
jgi:hypothetical protein